MPRRERDDDVDDDEIFAELEAELDDDNLTAREREHGMQEMMQ